MINENVEIKKGKEGKFRLSKNFNNKKSIFKGRNFKRIEHNE